MGLRAGGELGSGRGRGEGDEVGTGVEAGGVV